MFFEKKWGILIKKESESLDFTGLKIPRDYLIDQEGNVIERFEPTTDVDVIAAKVGKLLSEGQPLTLQNVYEFLKECGTYYLATVEEDQPRVRPFGTIALYENRLYIQTGKIKNVSKQIQDHPKVEICGFMNGQWIRVAGNLVRDESVAAKKFMLDQYPSLQSMYSAEDSNTEVLYFEDATATLSSFTGEPKVVRF